MKIKPKYDDVSSFGVEEYTTVSIVEEGEDGEEAANHYSIIDLDGNEILKLKDKYDYVELTIEGSEDKILDLNIDHTKTLGNQLEFSTNWESWSNEKYVGQEY